MHSIREIIPDLFSKQRVRQRQKKDLLGGEFGLRVGLFWFAAQTRLCRKPNSSRACWRNGLKEKREAIIHYQWARMRYFSTALPFLATGTLNCAANAAVLVYL